MIAILQVIAEAHDVTALGKGAWPMTTKHIPNLIPVEILQGDFDDVEIRDIYTTDLLSDVLANGRDSTVLITIQAHKNTVAVATAVDISLIILCNNRPVIDDMIEAAADARIGVMRTSLNQFEVSGRLWQAMHAPNTGRA
jgi:hypothetical protein